MDAMAGCWEALTDYDTLHHADGWTNLWMDLNEAGQPHKYLANQFERLNFDVLEVLLILFCHASHRLRLLVFIFLVLVQIPAQVLPRGKVSDVLLVDVVATN